jgi:hypothetical protein
MKICHIEPDIHIVEKGIAMEFLQEVKDGFVKIAEE